jgi:Domain of unknown function (DUF4282)/GYF domain 2
MAESRWFISIDGQQEGDFSIEETKAKIQRNPGKRILVWSQGMAQWADPADLPQFKAVPAPAPSLAPIPPPGPAPSPGTIMEQPVSHTKIDKDEIKKQAGILKGLLDFRFENFATLKIIPVVYALLLVVIVLIVLFAILVSGFGGLITAIKLSSFMLALTALGTMILAPLLGLLYLSLLRMSFETIKIIFRIKDDLATLVERGETKEEKKS